MPDVATIFTYLDDVFTGPVQATGAFVVGLFALIFLYVLVKELLDNARNR